MEKKSSIEKIVGRLRKVTFVNRQGNTTTEGDTTIKRIIDTYISSKYKIIINEEYWSYPDETYSGHYMPVNDSPMNFSACLENSQTHKPITDTRETNTIFKMHEYLKKISNQPE